LRLFSLAEALCRSLAVTFYGAIFRHPVETERSLQKLWLADVGIGVVST
jgi:hypothetical protein